MRGALRFLSVCSGMEAASAAWEPLGFSPVAFSEIDPAASAFLEQKFPSVPNWGDMTQFGEWPDAVVNLLVGGTPCQSFSKFGFREGLRDPRGNLALVYLALADRYRPRWLVWENVAGILSSDRGRDFASFLGGLGQLGYGFAFRVLDAQYYGVPQRRRRVFVVGYLGDWRRAAAVLFEPESVPGAAPSGARARAIASEAVPCGSDRRRAGLVSVFGGGNCSGPIEVAPTLEAHGTRIDFDCEAFVLEGNCPRRILPVEALRLQGFPDDWFDGIRFRGRPLADGPRFRMIGNSMAVPVMRWIGERIQLVDGIEVEP